MGARLGEALRWRPSWLEQSLDDCRHVTSASGALRSGSEGHVITIASFFGRKLRWAWKRWREEWEPDEKPLNPMRETKEENRGTTENILAP